MKILNKLVYKITLTIMIPVILISIIVSTILLNDISKKTEIEYTNYLESIVFDFVGYVNQTLVNISKNAIGDALLIESLNNLTSDDLIKLTTNNIEKDTLIFGSGIFFDRDMNPFNNNLAYFYSYRDGERIIEMIVDKDSDHITYDYIEHNPEWWETPSTLHKSGWTLPYSDTLSGSPSMITYFHPFYFQDEFAGVVTIDISLEVLEEWLINNENVLEANLNPVTFLVSEDSIIILSDLHETIGEKIFSASGIKKNRFNAKQATNVVSNAIAMETGMEIVSTIDGKNKKIAFYTPVHSTNWAAISMLPYDIVEKAVRESATKVFLIIIIFNLLLIVVIIMIARYISKPIINLSSVSLKIAEGDYTTKININSNDEIGVLADNFRLMKRNLRAREEEISEANKKYEIIFDNSPIGILYIDDTQTIVSYNNKFMEIIGIETKTNYIGKSVNVVEPSKKNKDILIEAIKTGLKKSYSSESFFNPGMFLQVNINPMNDVRNNNLGTIITVEDVTEQTKNTELKMKFDELEKFNSIMLDREMRIIELKEEVNILAKSNKIEHPYPEVGKV